MMEAVRAIHQLRVEAPVKQGQVLIEGVLGEKGVNVIACCSMERIIYRNICHPP
jgi:CxxC motif-containing protein